VKSKEGSIEAETNVDVKLSVDTPRVPALTPVQVAAAAAIRQLEMEERAVKNKSLDASSTSESEIKDTRSEGVEKMAGEDVPLEVNESNVLQVKVCGKHEKPSISPFPSAIRYDRRKSHRSLNGFCSTTSQQILCACLLQLDHHFLRISIRWVKILLSLNA
jgi:hypothetical protein